MLDTRIDLLKEIEDFLVKTGMSATRFGYMAVGDPGFIRMVRCGREPRNAIRAKVKRFIEVQDV